MLRVGPSPTCEHSIVAFVFVSLVGAGAARVRLVSLGRLRSGRAGAGILTAQHRRGSSQGLDTTRGGRRGAWYVRAPRQPTRFLHLGSTATGTGGPRIALYDMVNGGLPRDAATDGKPDRVYTACILTPNARRTENARPAGLTEMRYAIQSFRVKLELILRKHGGARAAAGGPGGAARARRHGRPCTSNPRHASWVEPKRRARYTRYSIRVINGLGEGY